MKEATGTIHLLGHDFLQNEGPADRAVRIGAGLALLAGAIFASGGTRLALVLLGAVGLITGVLGFCPLYLPFGLCTKREKGGSTT